MFDDFIKRGQVRRASEDKALTKSLLKNINLEFNFLSALEINEKSRATLMCNYYDILRTILEAIASVSGYKIYSHEAFTYFLKEIKNEEIISVKFDRFRKIRNSIRYYGQDVSVVEVIENIEEIRRMIDILIKKYLEGYDV